MKSSAVILAVAVGMLSVAALGAAADVKITGTLAFSSLKKLTSTSDFVFSGDTAQGIRDSRDASEGGNRNGQVDQAEADKWLKTFEESDEDDDSMKLDGIGFKQGTATATSNGLVGSSTNSTEPFTVHLVATVELKGEPASGNTHHLTVEKSDGGDSGTTDWTAKIRVPPGYTVTAVKGANKLNECEIQFTTLNEDLDLTMDKASGKCGQKSSGLGYGPVVALAAGLVAVALSRGRLR